MKMSQENNSIKSAFDKIYKQNLWGSQESKSGPGSTLAHTEAIRKNLPKLLNMLECKSLLDAPCGDFNWMKNVDLSDIEYIGVDIVDDMIKTNNEKYSSDSIKFSVCDITTEPLPKADAILCRDVMLHLPLAGIKNLLVNFFRSDIKYLLASHYAWSGDNTEVLNVVWGRHINLTKRPFFFPEPLHTIQDFPIGEPHRAIAVWSKEYLQHELGKQNNFSFFK